MVRGALAVAIAWLAACRFDASGVSGGVDARTDACATATCDPAATCVPDDADTYHCECPDDLTGDGLTCRRRWLALSAGEYFSCGIADDGSLRCWGNDDNGQLGDDAAVHRDLPAAIAFEEPGPWTAISAGYLHACGIFAGGLYCWGYGAYGQIGTGNNASALVPKRVGAADDWTAISAGGFHTCGLREGGTLWCWGYNGYGQVGIGNQMNQPSPVQVAGTWDSISAGGYDTCGIHGETIACWGYNASGEVGAGTPGAYPNPLDLSPSTGWRQVSTGYLHTCGLRTDGAYCWGYNAYGQLGTDGPSTAVPTRFSTESWTQLSAGGNYTCGVVIDGEARCWGDARAGQLGDGLRVQRSAPMPVSGERTWAVVTNGWLHTLALDDDGGAWSWGRNLAGELGAPSSSVSTPLALDDGWTMVRGGGDFSCGLGVADALSCFGWNDSGQLGDGSQMPHETPAALVIGGAWLDVAPAEHHACGIRADHALFCWGGDTSGEVGDGAGPGGSTPALAGDASAGWIQVDTGANHSCAITSGNTLYCWGYNSGGQLGQGGTAPTSSATYTSSAITQVALGDQHTCAIDSGMRLLCWGGNGSGEVGDGTAAIRQIPTLIDSGPWARIAAGGTHSCGIRGDGSLWCWGRDADGELGITQPGAITPTSVAAGTTWIDVTAGRRHTCGIQTDGTLWCWGDDEWGQIGDGDDETGDHNLPVQIGTETDWVDVDAGSYHTCAQRADGSAWCWGRRGGGQLGAAPYALAPIMIAD